MRCCSNAFGVVVVVVVAAAAADTIEPYYGIAGIDLIRYQRTYGYPIIVR